MADAFMCHDYVVVEVTELEGREYGLHSPDPMDRMSSYFVIMTELGDALFVSELTWSSEDRATECAESFRANTCMEASKNLGWLLI